MCALTAEINLKTDRHPPYYYSRLLWAKSMNACSWGYHQIPERSFFFKGYQFPVCARCCGTILGHSIAIFMSFFRHFISIPVAILMSVIMFFDWFIQYIGLKESNNKRRFVTGILGGLGTSSLYLRMLRILVLKAFKR